MARLPSGTVTFLFTDLEGHTALWEAYPDAMRGAMARHDAILREAVFAHDGCVVKATGDGLHAVFGRAVDALAAALDAQRGLVEERWEITVPLRARMGLHTGAAEERDGDYYGAAVNRAARVMAAGHGGQVLLSQITAGLVRDGLSAGVSLRDLGEHRLKDLHEPERLFQVVVAGLPDEFPPPKTLGTHPNNLPLQVTSFVGRERELNEVKGLLGSARLLTLTGAGGAGKTRLALQMAADTVEGFADGVWFVDLAAVTDPTLMAPTALAALQLGEVPRQDPISTLVEYLRRREALLVLDNCEHLLQSSADLASAIIRSCPASRVMVTSRELLGVSGESAWRVPSLGLPEADAKSTAASVSQCEAARLFIDRALAVQPSFRVTDQNAPALAQLCRRLDGIPLSIELAAARARVLTVEQIAARLNDRFRLLTGGGRTALRRQQTLQATVDWAHDLLDEREKALFRRLAVFAGGWTLEAAESVAQGAPIEAHNVLDLLSSLVDKSLVVADVQGAEERYGFLETIRQYAGDKLLQAGETAAVRDRHRDWCLDLAATHAYESRSERETLKAEEDNIRAALSWCASNDASAEAGLALISRVSYWWTTVGNLAEPRSWLDTFLHAAPEPTVVRAHALLELDHVLRLIGEFDAAGRAANEALTIFRELGDIGGEETATTNLGLVAANRGDYALGLQLVEQALASARARDHRTQIAKCLRDVSVICAAARQFQRARAAVDELSRLAPNGEIDRVRAESRLATLDRLEVSTRVPASG